MRRPHPRGREGNQRQPEEQVEVRPHHGAADALGRSQEVVMVVPVDPDHGEAEDVDEQRGHSVRKAVEVGRGRGLQIERHDRDDHRHDAVAERLEAVGVDLAKCTTARFRRRAAHPQRTPAARGCGAVVGGRPGVVRDADTDATLSPLPSRLIAWGRSRPLLTRWSRPSRKSPPLCQVSPSS